MTGWLIECRETEDEDNEDLDFEEEEEIEERISARPRRLSEIKIPTKVKPLPKASSFFLFSHTNRWVS